MYTNCEVIVNLHCTHSINIARANAITVITSLCESFYDSYLGMELGLLSINPFGPFTTRKKFGTIGYNDLRGDMLSEHFMDSQIGLLRLYASGLARVLLFVTGLIFMNSILLHVT